MSDRSDDAHQAAKREPVSNKLLLEIMEEMEDMEEQLQFEDGKFESREAMISGGDMPESYYRLRLIKHYRRI